MTFWCGSGSVDPCLWLIDPNIFIIDLQDANKKQIKKFFFCTLLFEGTFTSFFKDKKSKRSHKAVEIEVFPYYFCLMMEGSGSGSIPLTNGSGSGSRRPKNMWIRIRNTDLKKINSPPKPSSRRRRGPASVRLSRELSASLWNRTSISARAFTTGSSPTVTWAALFCEKCTKTGNKLLLIKGTGSRDRLKVLTKMNSLRAN